MLRGGAPEDVVSFASLATHTGSGMGVPTLAVRETVIAIGPCPVGPFSSKRSTGGTLPMEASANGENVPLRGGGHAPEPPPPSH